MLICSTEPLEVFMEFYDKLVPNIYTPEPSVMFEVSYLISTSKLCHYLIYGCVL